MARKIYVGGLALALGWTLLLGGCLVADNETALMEDSVEDSDAVIVSSITEGDYVIRSVATNKCLDVPSASTADGTRMQQWTCNGSNAQRFHISPTSDGYWKIVNVNSNKALDVRDVSTAPNAVIHQWTYVGGANQQWKLVNRGGTEFSIHARHTDQVVDLAWGNAADGTDILQYPYGGTTNQRWTLDRVSGGGGDTSTGGARTLKIINNCSAPIWVAHSTNVEGAQNVKLTRGAAYTYNVPEGGISATRFWPKTGCDESGRNCTTGDSVAPCPAGGCQPPFESKFEATFAAKGGAAQTWYNLSQVDGYTLPFKVVPRGVGAEQGSCITSDCSRLSLAQCPGDEDLGNGQFPAYAHQDLRVRDRNGVVVACMAPCKKWNYPAPWGLGQPESADPGLHLCCPTPIDPATGQCTAANACMTSDACRNTADPRSVEHTDYVLRMHEMCPTAYSYAYDDAAGLHACSSETSFEVTFCP
ncbi:RICIN domain-containing protein [Sorangium sp. So ce1151]|uniref:RICIN domain-containing protein n=1 Tax=Sorangium sp. So ce1151 TaxID=3133332 RepID=UPI003F638E3C